MPSEDAAIVTCLFISPWLGAILAARAFKGQEREWYDRLLKAPWNPPSWVFGPAWGILYILMGWSSYEYYQTQATSKVGWALYFAQLLVNWMWSPIFFGMRSITWGFYDILLLCLLIPLVIIQFSKVSTLAGMLLIPYFLWVLYATSLSAYIFFNN